MTNASYNHNSLIRLYRTLAEAALTHYDIGKARVSLLSFGRNAVFRVDAISRQAIAATAPPAEEDEGEESGSGDDVEQQDLSPEPISYTTRKARYVLRLCDARTANEDMIRSEAQWLLAMSSGNDRPQSALPVPEPVAGRDGSYVLRIQIEGIDLTVREGEYLSIVGPSGSGKSTLLHLLGLLDNPTDGVYRLDGVDTMSLRERRRGRHPVR